ncbi:hypothetical protein PILCRDRAFT_814984 [Piloderma croceum F 1598]|uniref:Uncharacterized protein n=1 Tax=Piloderma croceum (strain F 1598) TaxID=765440 RepID=A0A0C3CCP3_PILCF|nr:hypothetical protein PILCRDRAFT_814984 [Piloderma croceum F 1598]
MTGSMSHRRQNSDLLKATHLMEEVSLGGRDSLENQRDIPCSSDLMQSVPDDVLAEIFQAGTSLCRDPIDDLFIDDLPKLPFPHLVSSVSRRWRDVALSSPRLWTTIVFNCDMGTNHECPSLWIERSGACLLDITISTSPWNYWDSSSNLKSAMDQIIPHTNRWRRFTVDSLSQNMVRTVVARLRTASAPHLRDFKMISNDNHGFDIDSDSLGTMDVTSSVCDHIFTGGAPSLTKARLIGPYSMYRPPLTGLTYLQLGGSNHSNEIVTITANCLRDLLTASPFLTNLVLQCLDIVLPLNTSVSDIQIPSLCSLTMIFSSHKCKFWKLFSLLSLPKLATLALGQMSQFSELSIDVGPQSYPTVTVLELLKCGRIHHSLAKSLYSSFPSIIHFNLIGSSGVVPEHPHVQSDSDGAIIWPHLKTVTISYPLKYETICDFIDNREKMGHPLGTVNVWSRIRQEMAVIKLDNESKSNFPYLAGLKSAIEEVEYEEYEDRREEEERFHPDDFDRYGDSD